MKFFVLPNLASHEAVEIETHNGDLYDYGLACNGGAATRVPANITTKQEFSAWASNPVTDYCFFSTVEGTTPNLRVSESNPPRFLWGIVGDYDALMSDTEVSTLLARANPNFRPTFICRTFSGNTRLMWVFPERLPVFKQAHDAFCKILVKEGHLKRLLPGFDDKSLSPTQVFALGEKWERLSEELPSMNLLTFWLEKASRKVKWTHEGTVIPLDAVAEEVNLRFPGRWKGPFEVGARGCRFWDATSNNDTGAIIRETGVQCFTGDQPFVPWWQIFGSDFVKQFEADRIGKAIQEIWFDGDKYWYKSPAGHWVNVNKQDAMLHLEVACGLKPAKEGDDTSEVKRALFAIQNTRRIDGAVPLPGMHEGIVQYNGNEFLNTIRTRPIAPVSLPEGPGTMDAIRKGCPFILTHLARLLGKEQYWCFTAWLKRFYTSHYERKPLPGQVVVLAGTVAVGKTFTSNVIVSRLMGGFSDGSDYLMGRTQFNKDLMGVPLITVDDSTPTASAHYLNAFTSMLKRVAANHSMQFNAKYRDTYNMPNNSRTIVTCNADPESLRILPDTDQNVLDKVLLFLTEPDAANYRFPGDASEIVNRELPFYARYLIEVTIPERFLSPSRFGVAPWHHPELLDTARSSNASSSFKELLDLFLRAYFRSQPKADAWTGSSTQLLQEMLLDDGLKEIARQYKPVAVGRAMGQLMGQNEYVAQDRKTKERVWVVFRKFVGN